MAAEEKKVRTVTTPNDQLAKELATYESLRARLLADQGKFVVICGDELVGVFNDYEDALVAGYRKCGTSRPFLVKKIEQDESAHHFSRDVIAPCHP